MLKCPECKQKLPSIEKVMIRALVYERVDENGEPTGRYPEISDASETHYRCRCGYQTDNLDNFVVNGDDQA